MAVNRRQFLVGSLAAAAASAGLTACGGSSSGGSSGGSSSGGGANGPASLALAWWGNDVRNKNTSAAITAYTTAHPKVKVTPQPGEWASYWDKLATQTAGGTAPDIIQMDMAYISEYGHRGALLDLSKYGADTSKFATGTVASGKIDGTLYGMNAGINTLCLLANPAVFQKAGVAMPDDTTWTWDDLMSVGADVASKAGVPFGIASLFASSDFMQAWLRQRGKDLFDAKGLAFSAADVTAWLDMSVKYQKAGAVGTPALISEEATKTLDQSALATGKAALQVYWSNQVEAVNAAAGTDMKILRYPSTAGSAAKRKAWYKASMLWSVSAKTKYPEAAVAMINWWMNSPESANINLAERGIQPNAQIQTTIQPKLSPTQQAVAKFIADIKPELSTTPPALPPGGGTIGAVLLRHYTDVLFGKASTSAAASAFVDEVKSNLTT
jgi:multiple sugar transport system substrate-binding protein